MSIFSNLKKWIGPSTPNNPFEQIIEQSYLELGHDGGFFWVKPVSQLKTYKAEVAKWTDSQKVEFMLFCFEANHQYQQKTFSYSSKDPLFHKSNLRSRYPEQILKTKMNLTDEEVERLISAAFKYFRERINYDNGWPILPILRNLKRQYKRDSLSPKLKDLLQYLLKELKPNDNPSHEKVYYKIDDLIQDLLFKENATKEAQVKKILFIGQDPFGIMANDQIQSFATETSEVWYQLLRLTKKANGSKPSQKFLKESHQLIKSLKGNQFKEIVGQWMSYLAGLKETEITYTEHYRDGDSLTFSSLMFLHPSNTPMVKGLVWMLSHFHDKNTLHLVAQLGDRCYRKIPGVGPAAAALGNACFYVLYKSKGLEGIGQLSRLKQKIKPRVGQNIIQKYLLQAAKEKGVSISEIEEIAAPDFGLEDGTLQIVFDDYLAVLEIQKVGSTVLKWLKPDGKFQKSIPSFVKEVHAKKLKTLKNTKKQIEQALVAQRDRLDHLFRKKHSWTFEKFAPLYLKHGLLSYLGHQIIWSFTHESKKQAGLYRNGKWLDFNGQPFDPNPNSEVNLWHPALHAVEEIQAWRSLMIDREIQQPFKQAFREVYLLTEAELNTKTYSNRMAAHILKQHQFNSLAQARSWKYTLMGGWDHGSYMAHLPLEDFGIRAEYWLQEVNNQDEMTDTGIYNYIATDQVRFTPIEGGEPIPLIDIPPVIFSEIMRDVDLFVGVASVGNDPSWIDSGGGVTAHRDYWHAYSFGNLSEIAKNRKSILENLVPRLKIKNVAHIEGKFLIVQGKIRTYKIHIGSTNILMEPNDQYLCIVSARNQKPSTDKVFVPFEGDRGLSIILSKAFLLAEDDCITDSTIVSQIGKG